MRKSIFTAKINEVQYIKQRWVNYGFCLFLSSVFHFRHYIEFFHFTLLTFKFEEDCNHGKGKNFISFSSCANDIWKHRSV